MNTIYDFHEKNGGQEPVIYFIIAGTLGTWLVSKLHGQLSKSYLIDLGLALEPLFANEKTAASNPYSFAGFGKKDGQERRKYKTENKNYFIHKKLGYKIEVDTNKTIKFHTPPISRLVCEIKCFKTKMMYKVYNNLKGYRFANSAIVRSLIKLYRK